jgi:PIF1-like helicase
MEGGQISMLDGSLFDKLEAVARAVRRKECPWGGIQLVLTGDFHQLPPVAKYAVLRIMCFQALSWSLSVEACLLLRHVHRQVERPCCHFWPCLVTQAVGKERRKRAEGRG